MKVLDLQCGLGHAFEGWFSGEEEFQQQLGRGMVACPLCGDVHVVKLPSAPRLNFGSVSQAGAVTAAEPAAAPGAKAPVAMPAAMQAAWLRMARHVMANTEDVGVRFAEEARRIHYGEAEERGIRGQASLRDAAALLEEGVAVLPLPDVLKEPLQ